MNSNIRDVVLLFDFRAAVIEVDVAKHESHGYFRAQFHSFDAQSHSARSMALRLGCAPVDAIYTTLPHFASTLHQAPLFKYT